MSVEIHVRYEGDLRCRAMHGPSGRELLTDAPVDNHGRGESFSPTDLVATALGTCMLTIMGIVAERDGWDLAGTRVEVSKHMVADPVRRIGRLDVDFHVPRDPGSRGRTVLERAARSCPVHRSLGEDVEVHLAFHWGAESAPPRP